MENLHIKSVSACTMDEVTELWNKGFQQDYSDKVHTSWHRMSKMRQHYIHPDLSIAAYIDGQPAGFVLIGWREELGRKMAWNGGTGVVPKFRGQGLSKRLLLEAIRRVKGAGADSLTLEAMTVNDRAIRAYRSCGFEKVDQLHILQLKEDFTNIPFPVSQFPGYTEITGLPERVAYLSFYVSSPCSWTSQWFNLDGGSSLIVYDRKGAAAGYALFQEKYNETGYLSSIKLFHCEADPGRTDRRDLIHHMLTKVMRPEVSALTRTAHYIRASNGEVIDALVTNGFITTKKEHLMELKF